MPSPFPGMDPYLEGHLWPDVHSALAGKLRQLLAPLIRPRYAARLGVYVVEDTAPEADVGIMYPDLEVLLVRPRELHETPAQPGAPRTPAPIAVPVLAPVEVPLVSVEIHDAAQGRLVTSIEILSPVNKREPGLGPYRQKRLRLIRAGIHLVELDLLRRGARPFAHPRVPPTDYAVALTRAHAREMLVWPISLRDQLPPLPIPLLPPDEEVTLDLGAALRSVYDEAAYELSISYHQPPPPPALDESTGAWALRLIEGQ